MRTLPGLVTLLLLGVPSSILPRNAACGETQGDPLLRECVRKAVLERELVFPEPRYGIYYQATAQAGEAVIPYIEELVGEKTAKLYVTSASYFLNWIHGCVPAKHKKLIADLISKFPDDEELRLLAARAGDYSQINAVVRNWATRAAEGDFASRATAMSYHFLEIKDAARKDPAFRAYLDKLLAEAQKSGEYDAAPKVYLMLEADPPKERFARIRKEQSQAVEALARSPAQSTAEEKPAWDSEAVKTAWANIDVLIAVQNAEAMSILDETIRSGAPWLQHYLLERFRRLDQTNQKKLFPAVAEVAKKPATLVAGCLVFQLHFAACDALLAADREKARPIIESLLDSSNEELIRAAAYTLARTSPPCLAPDEMRKHAATSGNPEKLKAVLDELAARAIFGTDADKRLVKGLMESPSSYVAGNAGLDDKVVTLFRSKDREFLLAFEGFIENGEKLHTKPEDPNMWNIYDYYFEKLWVLTEGLKRAYPEAPEYKKWFWLCASKEETAEARKRILAFVRGLASRPSNTSPGTPPR